MTDENHEGNGFAEVSLFANFVHKGYEHLGIFFIEMSVISIESFFQDMKFDWDLLCGCWIKITMLVDLQLFGFI